MSVGIDLDQQRSWLHVRQQRIDGAGFDYFSADGGAFGCGQKLQLSEAIER